MAVQREEGQRDGARFGLAGERAVLLTPAPVLDLSLFKLPTFRAGARLTPSFMNVLLRSLASRGFMVPASCFKRSMLST